MSTPKMNTSLSEIFNIELTQTDKSLDVLKIDAKAESIDSLETQRTYVKNNLVELIEKGKKALDSMTTIAESTEAGKDFTVVSELIKTLVDTNMTLLECEVVHKPKEELKTGTTNNNTAVFIGSTTELSNYLSNSTINS